MKLIYIAAPYTGPTWFDIAENIRALKTSIDKGVIE